MSTLNEKFKLHYHELSPKERWHIEMALYLEQVPEYIWAYFNRFEREEESSKVVEKEIIQTTTASLSLEERKVRLLKERAHLHGKLSLLATAQERYEVARAIISDIQPKLRKIYRQLDEVRENGRIITPDVPDTERAIIEKTKTLLRRRNTLESLISKNKVSYATTGNPKFIEENKRHDQELRGIKAYLYTEES